MRDRPHVLLLKAAARLHAHGETALAQDVHQLARHWTPDEYDEVVGERLPPPILQLQQQPLWTDDQPTD
jgi:hypothetical protein